MTDSQHIAATITQLLGGHHSVRITSEGYMALCIETTPKVAGPLFFFTAGVPTPSATLSALLGYRVAMPTRRSSYATGESRGAFPKRQRERGRRRPSVSLHLRDFPSHWDNILPVRSS